MQITYTNDAIYALLQLSILHRSTVLTVSIECVSCRENNLYSIGSSTHIKLAGGCRDCGVLTLHQYHWEAVRDDGVPLVLDGNTTRTGNNKPSLSIKQGVLADGHSYKFSLNVSDYYNGWGYAMMELRAGKPPSDGTCELILPVSGVVETLHDSITVNCTGWRGHLPLFQLLTYHVFLRSVDSTSSVWYPVYRGTNSHCTFRVAPFEDDLEAVEVVVEVIDKVGAMKTALVQ